MNDPFYIRIFLEYCKCFIIITKINFIIFYFLTGNFFNAFK